MPVNPPVLAAACLILSLAPLNATLAEEDLVDEDAIDRELAEGGEKCIRTRSVVKTTVVDDQTILFYVRGSAIYVNVLPKSCKRLSREGRFMYESAAGRLCESDLINVLEDSGFGLGKGRSCKLGSFRPITEEQIKSLSEPESIEAQPIPPAEPEEPN